MYSQFDANLWVTPFGLVFLGAIFAAWLYARRNAIASGIDGSHIDLLMPVTLIVGVAGGTLIAMFMPADQMIAGETMNQGLRVRLFYLLGSGTVALFVYSRLTRMSFRSLLDVFALPTLVGLMIHRFGCFLAGCCWGDLVKHDSVGDFASQIQTLPWLSGLGAGVQYPPGSLPFEQHVALGLIEPSAMASLPVVPVQLYEAALLFVMLLAMFRFPWRKYPKGTITVLAACTYALVRFFLEYLRADGAIMVANLTVTQLQCLLLLSTSILLPGMLRR